MKSDIENFNLVFQIKDDGRNGGKCTCKQLMAINKEVSGDRKNLFTFNVDRGWRFPSLARVLLCMVRVGVPRVSWAVRYLDKLQWRAMICVWDFF